MIKCKKNSHLSDKNMYLEEGDDRQFAEFLKKFSPRARSCLTLLLFIFNVNKRLIRLSIQQWNHFMTNSDRWMGAIAL